MRPFILFRPDIQMIINHARCVIFDFNAVKQVEYAAFGQVIEGMEVVDKIASCKTGRYGFYSDVPRVCIMITDAAVVAEA